MTIRGDAAMVDIIHTNGGPIIDGCLALSEPLGHADFYPNGGKHQVPAWPSIHQPGCTPHICVARSLCLNLDLGEFVR